ncbi:MAG: hypothetical protein LBE57_05265 [Methanosarcinales archaeon]|jgi:plastocyanin|nr:hypothetical protein [Methanosarcinales archaeon]
MVKSKALMILAVLVLLFAAVSLSGCLGGGDADNNTTNNTTPPGNNTTPPENNTTPPENNTTTPPGNNTTTPPAGSVTVTLGDQGPSTPILVQISNQRFPQSTLNISTGDTIGFRNAESRAFRHLYHSENNAFEDFTLDMNRRAALTFNQPGTYRIELLNAYTGEPYGDTPSVLTVNVR